MSLAHEFIAFKQPVCKEILCSEDIYEYIKLGKLEKIVTLEVPDEIIQELIYDTYGNLLPDVYFNHWGISVYEQSELMKWIDFLENSSESNKNLAYCHKLIHFFKKSYDNNYKVLHFGI